MGWDGMGPPPNYPRRSIMDDDDDDGMPLHAAIWEVEKLAMVLSSPLTPGIGSISI